MKAASNGGHETIVFACTSSKSNLRRGNVFASHLLALAVALMLGPTLSFADVIRSGIVNLNIPSDATYGLKLNVVTGVTNEFDPYGPVPGWDLYLGSSDTLAFYSPNAPSGGAYKQMPGTPAQSGVHNLPSSWIVAGSGNWSSGNAITTGPYRFLLNSDNNYVGFRFVKECTGTTHFGWMRLSIADTLEGQPRTLIEYAYESEPDTPIQIGDMPPEPCVADVSRNGIVDGADISIALSSWGLTGSDVPGDINGDRAIDGADLSLILSSWGICAGQWPTTFTGTVIMPDGSPVSNASIASNFGGITESGNTGEYGLEVALDASAYYVTLNAVAIIDGVAFAGIRQVDCVARGGNNEVFPIVIVPVSDACDGQLRWDSGVGSRGLGCAQVNALAVFNDGMGDAVYAAQCFTNNSGTSLYRIARWGEDDWSSIGDVTGSGAHALAVFDDGNGPALYAAGSFGYINNAVCRSIARWDGSAWTPLGDGIGGTVLAITVFDDGTGPALYAAGSFAEAGGFEAHNIARWDGSSWTNLGAGTDRSIHALAVFNDGTGPALYAAGTFGAAGGISASRIARWDGASWSAVGSGMNDSVLALTVFDDGKGASLYAAGTFTGVGDMPANRIARWNGRTWSESATHVNVGSIHTVHALTVFDDGAGPALYAGGSYVDESGRVMDGIARYDDSVWTGVAGGVDGSVFSMEVFDDGNGPAIVVGGRFSIAGDAVAKDAAAWDGASWRPLSNGAVGQPAGGQVWATTMFDDGKGSALYVGGSFTTAGSVAASNIARWNGIAWSPLGVGTDLTVYSLVSFDDGTGPALYAGGHIRFAGGTAASGVARWDGTSWSQVGNGVSLAGSLIGTYALAVFDDGTGPALYAAGNFAIAGGISANRIARWDGISWSSLGSGLNAIVFSLAVFDDGTGPALYAAGNFTIAGGIGANRIARWDGTSWSPVGSGMNQPVYALTSFNDGTGDALYASGAFSIADGYPTNAIARWDGTSWTSVGSWGSPANGFPTSLAVFDDGSGPALYAGGSFSVAGGVVAKRIARWDGGSWSALDNGISGYAPEVRALFVFDDGTGPGLYAGGKFWTAGGMHVGNIARWGCKSP